MNSDSVVKGFDVFKNQVVCVSVILNVKTVKPFPFYEWMEGFNAGIVIRITFMWITALHVFGGFTPCLRHILASAVKGKSVLRIALTWVFLYASYINKSCKLISWTYSSITYHRMSIYRLYFTVSSHLGRACNLLL